MKKLVPHILVLILSVSTIDARPVPFDPVAGIVQIEVIIDDSIKAHIGLDTGADRFYLDKQFALDNNIEILQTGLQQNIQGVHGTVKPKATSIKRLQISDDITLENLNATVIELSEFTKEGEHPDGLIGYQILKDYFVSCDFIKHTIEFHREAPRFLRGNTYAEIPFRLYNHLIVVDVLLNDKLSVPMLLDYCSSFTTITTETAEKLGIPLRDDRKAVIESVDIDGVINEHVWAYLSDMEEFRKVNAGLEFDGIIGVSFLYNKNITIDYRSKKIYIRD